jgi:hypothetical protein
MKSILLVAVDPASAAFAASVSIEAASAHRSAATSGRCTPLTTLPTAGIGRAGASAAGSACTGARRDRNATFKMGVVYGGRVYYCKR